MSAKDNENLDMEFCKTMKLMNNDEIIKLNHDRKLFLLKVSCMKITKEDVVTQINDELKLFEICKFNRRNISDTHNDVKFAGRSILNIICSRINNLYYSLFQWFPIEISLLKEYMKFCLDYVNYITDGKELLNKLISSEHNDPAVYITAAEFEFKYECNMKITRNYLSQGFKYHSHSKQFCIEDFWMEFQYLDYTNGASIKFAINKYYIFKNIFQGDLKFHFMLLDRIIQYKNINKLHYLIVKDMADEYKDKIIMWQKLGNICLKGFNYEFNYGQLVYDQHCIRRLTNFISIYEHGLSEIPIIRREKLWNLYINYMKENWIKYGLKDEPIQSFMNSALDKMFHDAKNEGVIRASDYIYWTAIIIEENIEVLNNAIELNRNNTKDWFLVLNHFLENKYFEKAIKVFKHILESLGNKAHIAWEYMMLYENNLCDELREEFYILGSQSEIEEVNLFITIKYLEFKYSKFHDLSSVRKLFEEFKLKEPSNKKLYISMIDLEKSAEYPDNNYIARLYIETCIRFGRRDVELWLLAFQFLYNKCYSKMNYLHNLIIEVLDSDLRSVLNDSYTKCEQTLWTNINVVQMEVE